MKKALALFLTMAMLLSACFMLTFTASADGGYTVTVNNPVGITPDTLSSTDAPIVMDGVSVAADAAVPNTFSCLCKVVANDTVIKEYTLFIDGTENKKAVSANFNAGNDSCTVFITLSEGTYTEILVNGVDAEGNRYDVFKFTNLTVTEPIHSISDEGWEVDTNPCWTLTSDDLVASSSNNAVTIQANEAGYATFYAESTGDPYTYYAQGTEIKTGRYLLIKYNNHTIIPRMQIYMAQEAGIVSDSNMIEFDIAANNSGWTYVIVDLANNSFYNKDTQTLYYFRFDPLEARNINGGAYTFTGEETIDVAYIKGFTTRAGVQGYLEANELHPVTKTATLVESQLTASDDGYTYTDKDGNVYPVTAHEDGTYSYTFEAMDVRDPVNATPKLLIDGSKLIGSSYNSSTVTKDDTTGIATLTATGADANYMVFSEAKTAARYMAVRYRTSINDSMEFFLSSSDNGPAGGQSFKRPLVNDGAWHTDIIDLSTVNVSTLNTETYALNFLRFDFFDTASEGTLEVEYIAFFDSEDAAFQYNHVYKTYTVTFTASNQVVAKVIFEAGATSVQEPEVPAKEGYTGAWAEYTMADKNFTVKAIYTAIADPAESETETETYEPAESETDTGKETDTASSVESTGAATTSSDPVGTSTGKTAETTSTSSGGCKSVVSGAVAVLALSAVAAVTAFRKKKES